MKVVSGIRPTGFVHLGNYLGAIKQWKAMPGTYFVADLHSIEDFSKNFDTRDALHKCGIEYVELESNHRQPILELYHELSFQVPIGWLKRMTQFKDKSQSEDATLALLSYPVLMAADIFYFGGTHIPIGSDQQQHLELIRDMATRAGRLKPEAILGDYPRIMSLTDGSKKMSKSDPNDYSRINVMDKPQVIRDKIMKAKSATFVMDNTPEMNNLRLIYKAVGGYEDHVTCKAFKEHLASLIIAELNA